MATVKGPPGLQGFPLKPWTGHGNPRAKRANGQCCRLKHAGSRPCLPPSHNDNPKFGGLELCIIVHSTGHFQTRPPFRQTIHFSPPIRSDGRSTRDPSSRSGHGPTDAIPVLWASDDEDRSLAAPIATGHRLLYAPPFPRSHRHVHTLHPRPDADVCCCCCREPKAGMTGAPTCLWTPSSPSRRRGSRHWCCPSVASSETASPPSSTASTPNMSSTYATSVPMGAQTGVCSCRHVPSAPLADRPS